MTTHVPLLAGASCSAKSLLPEQLTPAHDVALARKLEHLLLDTPAPSYPSTAAASAAPAVPDADSSWPAGPLGLRPHTLAALFQRLLLEPSIMDAAQADQAGLTKNRLIKLRVLPAAQADLLAQALMVWFDTAGLLAAAITPWREPRRLLSLELDQIAARLSATPLPTTQAVQAAFGR